MKCYYIDRYIFFLESAPEVNIMMPLKYHYTVNNKKFINFFDAHDYAHENSNFVDFKLSRKDIESFCSVDVEELATKNIVELYKNKLSWARDNFSKLRFLYSGGTDSQTIMEISQELGINFDEVLTELCSIKGDPELDTEYLPAIEYLTGKKIKNFHLIRPEIKHYEIYKDPMWVKDVCASHYFSFRGAKFDIVLREREQMTCLTGQDKPFIYVDAAGKYYWVVADHSFSEDMRSDQLCFFIDSFMPEVAVKQAYMAKKFLQDFYPNWRGLFKNTHRMPTRDKRNYLKYLGRVKPLSPLTLDPTLMGKGSPPYVSKKHTGAMEELERIGRGDLVQSFFDSINEVKERYKHHQHCFEIDAKGHPIAVGRWAAVFELGDNVITHVDDSVIDLSLRS